MLVAVIGKPFGVKGEVTVASRTSQLTDVLVPGAAVTVKPQGLQTEVVSARVSPDGGVVSLACSQDRNFAEQLRGSELWSDVASKPSTGPDEWVASELVGLPCRSPSGDLLGEVMAVEEHPAHDTLLVRTPEGDEVMVPFVKQIVPDVSQSGLVITDPGGLFPTGDSS